MSWFDSLRDMKDTEDGIKDAQKLRNIFAGTPTAKVLAPHELEGPAASAFAIANGGLDVYSGFNELSDGNTFDGLLDVGKGGANIGGGISSLAGAGGAAGGFQLVSGGLGVLGGAKKMMSDDLPTATEGTHEVLEGGLDTMAGALGGPGTPGGALATSAATGARIGHRLVNYTDRVAAERDYFGDHRTGSRAAADTGRSVDEWFDGWAPDVVGDIAGGATTIFSSWGNAAYSGARGLVSGAGDLASDAISGIGSGVSSLFSW